MVFGSTCALGYPESSASCRSCLICGAESVVLRTVAIMRRCEKRWRVQSQSALFRCLKVRKNDVQSKYTDAEFGNDRHSQRKREIIRQRCHPSILYQVLYTFKFRCERCDHIILDIKSNTKGQDKILERLARS